MPCETHIGKTVLCLVTGDIAEQDTDAVVTAAHWRLNKGIQNGRNIVSLPTRTILWMTRAAMLRR